MCYTKFPCTNSPPLPPTHRFEYLRFIAVIQLIHRHENDDFFCNTSPRPHCMPVIGTEASRCLFFSPEFRRKKHTSQFPRCFCFDENVFPNELHTDCNIHERALGKKRKYWVSPNCGTQLLEKISFHAVSQNIFLNKGRCFRLNFFSY